MRNKWIYEFTFADEKQTNYAACFFEHHLAGEPYRILTSHPNRVVIIILPRLHASDLKQLVQSVSPVRAAQPWPEQPRCDCGTDTEPTQACACCHEPLCTSCQDRYRTADIIGLCGSCLQAHRFPLSGNPRTDLVEAWLDSRGGRDGK